MITLRKPRVTEQQKHQIRKAYRGKMTLRDIRKTYHVALTTIYRIIKEGK